MSQMNTVSPIFGPVLFAGMFLSPLPVAPINKSLERITRAFVMRHPGVIDRLSSLPVTEYLILPADIPFAFIISVADGNLKITCTKDKSLKADVKISGNFTTLLSLLDGGLDGDAVFFSRELIVEGNTEAIVALRNALDSEDINIMTELEEALPFFRYFVRFFAFPLKYAHETISGNISIARQALISPMEQRYNSIMAKEQKLQERVDTLEKQSIRTKQQIERIRDKIKGKN